MSAQILQKKCKICNIGRSNVRPFHYNTEFSLYANLSHIFGEKIEKKHGTKSVLLGGFWGVYRGIPAGTRLPAGATSNYRREVPWVQETKIGNSPATSQEPVPGNRQQSLPAMVKRVEKKHILCFTTKHLFDFSLFWSKPNQVHI